MQCKIHQYLGTAALFLLGVAQAGAPEIAAANHPYAKYVANERGLYIVQSTNAQAARKQVLRSGGEVQQSLSIINAVTARLTPRQVAALQLRSDLHVFNDRKLAPMATIPTAPLVFTDGTAVSGRPNQYVTDFPLLVNAYPVWQSGITGRGVTIAVLDTGIWNDPAQNYGSRILATVDVTNGGSGPVTGDPYGHGTHITSIAAGGANTLFGTHFGIAPSANLVIVRAFDGEGQGRYADVISGLNWIVANQKKYNIRVLNLSFGAPPESYYWNDPLNQAVMAAWRAGIVVVVAAGNRGPAAMTIGVPGNVPYVITIGALTDNYTPYLPTDDRLAAFSSTGPTYEGFVKPDLVAPGGHMVGSMWYGSYLANIDPGSMTSKETLFTMSGTSQAAAVTSGVVALMLQANPMLNPDTVKCRLLASATPALSLNGTLAYSIFQQGAGLINASNAVHSTASGCANRGLNIAADLAGTQHYGGPANEDASGNYYVMNMTASTWGTPITGDGYTWTQSYAYNQGYTWSQGYTWTNGYAWTQGYTWTEGYTWTAGYTWSQGYTWTTSVPWSAGSLNGPTAPASIEDWVPNE
jgi:serine protease AprX